MDHDASAREWLDKAPFPIPPERKQAAVAWLTAALRSASSAVAEPTETDRMMLQLGRLRGDFVQALERNGVEGTPENVAAVLKLAEHVMLEGGTVVADELAARFARNSRLPP